MNKSYSLSVVAACALVGFASCSNEDFQGGAGTISVPVRTNITVGDASTRTSLDEDSGNLVWKWEKGDQVVVICDGNNIGTLTADKPNEGGKTAPFAGTLQLPSNAKTARVKYYYLGKDVDPASLGSSLVIDLATQSGAFNDLVKKDVLESNGGENNRGFYTLAINPEFTVIPDFGMDHMTAHAHYKLQLADGTVFPAGTDVTVAALPSTGSINVKKTVNLTDWSTSNMAGSISAKVMGADGDFYLTHLPYRNAAEPYGPNYEFTAEMNGKTYTGILSKADGSAAAYVIEAGKFYRASDFGPLVITMATEEEAAVDHSKNPLLKWAKTNLDLSTSTGFAENNWDRGQLFQFGRNCGYENYSDARRRYAVYCSEDTSSPWNVWGFNVYNGMGTGSKVTYSYSKSGVKDSDPDEYFWIADQDCGATSNGDWWPARANMDDNWSTRATAEGWSKADPSPEGWHIATTAEYDEIMPKQKSNSNQSSVFGNGEIRTNKDCTYAIRWDITKKTLSSNNVRYVLAVKCLVVAAGTAYSDVDWTDTNVQVLYFPSAGYINSGYTNFAYWYPNGYGNNINYWIARQEGVHPGYGYIKAGNQRAALPCPVGLINYVPKQVGSSVAVQYQIAEDHSNFRTSYWTADGDCFGFSYDLDKQWDDPYFIGMHKTYKKTFAMPLRCVAD